MGAQVDPARVGPGQRRAFRERLAQSLEVLAGMLADHAATGGVFEDDPPTTGTEVECVLVAGGSGPARAGAPWRGTSRVLADLGDPAVVPEIGAHTLELNVPPSVAGGHGLAGLEDELRARLTTADAAARAAGGRLLLVGVLPTLLPEHLREDWMTPSARYAALQDAVLSARGEDVALDITGPGSGRSGAGGRPDGERLSLTLPSIAAEAACTSTQLHLKTAPEDFAATWNAAQLLAGPLVALAGNSPFALGRRLWAESRIPLFTQSVDTRTPELVAQGVRPRVFAGEGWATGVLDLLTEDATWFEPLLPQLEEEDPALVRAGGGVPALAELGLHSGTVWRWNRPVYDVTPPVPARRDPATGAVQAPVPARAHLRVENRVLPSGPTVLDTVANAAVFYGAVRALVDRGPDPAVLLPAGAPARSLLAGARDGLDAEVDWPGAGRTSARRVLLERVLPLAAQGLDALGVPAALADRYLDVAAARASTGRTGAAWQVAALTAAEDAGADRVEALHAVLAAYTDHQDAGGAVHTWPWPR